MINVILSIITELLLFGMLLFLAIHTIDLKNRLKELEEKVRNLDW